MGIHLLDRMGCLVDTVGRLVDMVGHFVDIVGRLVDIVRKSLNSLKWRTDFRMYIEMVVVSIILLRVTYRLVVIQLGLFVYKIDIKV